MRGQVLAINGADIPGKQKADIEQRKEERDREEAIHQARLIIFNELEATMELGDAPEYEDVGQDADGPEGGQDEDIAAGQGVVPNSDDAIDDVDEIPPANIGQWDPLRSVQRFFCLPP
jgi:hypothetical protein